MVQYADALDVLKALHPNRVRLATMVQGCPGQQQFDVPLYKREDSVDGHLPAIPYSKILADGVLAADAALGSSGSNKEEEEEKKEERCTSDTVQVSNSNESSFSVVSDMTLVNLSVNNSSFLDYRNFNSQSQSQPFSQSQPLSQICSQSQSQMNLMSPHAPTTQNIRNVQTSSYMIFSPSRGQSEKCKRKAEVVEDSPAVYKRQRMHEFKKQEPPDWISSSSAGNILSSDAIEVETQPVYSDHLFASRDSEMYRYKKELAFPAYREKDISQIVYNSFDPIDSDL